jgi:hypothetical protein
MKGQDERQVHELFCLGVQGTSYVGLPEVLRIALARVEVTSTKLRHRQILHSDGCCRSSGVNNPTQHAGSGDYSESAVLMCPPSAAAMLRRPAGQCGASASGLSVGAVQPLIEIVADAIEAEGLEPHRDRRGAVGMAQRGTVMAGR